eukprot:5352975-Prymnesium_polylepis.1
MRPQLSVENARAASQNEVAGSTSSVPARLNRASRSHRRLAAIASGDRPRAATVRVHWRVGSKQYMNSAEHGKTHKTPRRVGAA